MGDDFKGDWIRCEDNASTLLARSVNSSYSVELQKKLNPLTMNLLLKNDKELEEITKTLKKKYKRKPKSVPLNGESMFNALLAQIVLVDNFGCADLRNQIGHFGSKFWDLLDDILLSEEQSAESFLRNIFNGYALGNKKILEIVAIMWNAAIDIVTPGRSIKHIRHDGSRADFVLIHNGYKGKKSHYSATGRCFLFCRSLILTKS